MINTLDWFILFLYVAATMVFALGVFSKLRLLEERDTLMRTIEELRKKNCFTTFAISPMGDWKVDIRKGVVDPQGQLRESMVVTNIGPTIAIALEQAKRDLEANGQSI